MKIKQFFMRPLHNGEHVTFNEETLEHLRLADPELLGVSEQIETYRNAVDEEKLTIDVLTASELAPESVKIDKQRDRAYSAFKSYLKLYAHDTDNVLSEAAKRLLFVIRKSSIELGNPLRLGSIKETTAINSLLRNLEPLSTDIELIGATKRLSELAAANRSFEELQIARNIEKASKHKGNVKETRAVTDAAYNSIIERINAQALLRGGDAFESFIKEQNTIIDKYATLIAKRKGSKKSESKVKTETTTQDQTFD
jgi:hypothetical protein